MAPKRKTPTKICPVYGCKKLCSARAVMCLDCRLKKRQAVATQRLAALPEEQVVIDREKVRTDAELKSLRERYKESLKTIGRQESALRIIAELRKGLEIYTIKPSTSSGTGEATVIAVASDWHIEEKVGAEVGGLNIFSIEIARQRAERFFQKTLRLTNLLAQDIKIPTIVLALLGDFISGDIHEEFAENSNLLPMHAIVEAQNLIAAGIRFLLNNSDRNLVIPAHSGNHARTTLTTRSATENGHSLEYLMYMCLQAVFKSEPRVRFIIPEGPHSYLQVYDTMVRFQHGHQGMRYGGGVGGIYIPVHKAIAEFNKARRADLDIFGHFHQARDGGNFVSNGSLIGYNAFALCNHFAFEEPKQQLMLIDKARGRTCLWPILLK